MTKRIKKKAITLEEMRKMGGEATLKKHGTAHFKKMSQKGVEARWGKGKKDKKK